MTSELVNSIRHRDSLGVQLKMNPFDDHLAQHYKHVRNKVSKAIRSAKINFKRTEIHNCDTPKKKWQAINDFFNRKAKNTNSIKKTEHANVEIDCTTDIDIAANIFNDYFSKVGQTLTLDIQSTCNTDITQNPSKSHKDTHPNPNITQIPFTSSSNTDTYYTQNSLLLDLLSY